MKDTFEVTAKQTQDSWLEPPVFYQWAMTTEQT